MLFFSGKLECWWFMLRWSSAHSNNKLSSNKLSIADGHSEMSKEWRIVSQRMLQFDSTRIHMWMWIESFWDLTMIAHILLVKLARDLTRVFTPNGGLVREISFISGTSRLVKYNNLARYPWLCVVLWFWTVIFDCWLIFGWLALRAKQLWLWVITC